MHEGGTSCTAFLELHLAPELGSPAHTQGKKILTEKADGRREERTHDSLATDSRRPPPPLFLGTA